MDVESAGCQFFYERYEDLVYRINEYNIYSECYGRNLPPQASLVAAISLKMSKFNNISKFHLSNS